ncbi:MAG: hypothetical protein JW940_15630 [Polyangiaceae bacterium]|nr:hypothetical protein [Polyangiaceae bacterium]
MSRQPKTIPPDPAREEPSAVARLHRIVLLEEERVADRGRSSTRWFVNTRRGWQRPGAIAAGAAVLEPSAARTVWSRRWELALAEGTLLMRCDTRPAEHERREPLELLLGRYGSQEQLVRRYYRVCRSGRLAREGGRS